MERERTALEVAGVEERRSVSPAERVERLRWLAALYQLSSSAFLEEPDDAALAAQIAAARQAVETQEGWELPCEEQLLAYLAGLDGTDSDLGRRIRSEYAELFVGPRPPLAPLYESIYRGSPRRLLTAVTREVREAYERSGFAVVRKNRVPDDHIGYELEFVARLCQQEAEALNEGDDAAALRAREARMAFLAAHLAQWVVSFDDRVRGAIDAYYAAWSAFVRDLVTTDVGQGW